MMGADPAWLLFGALACGLGVPLVVGAAVWVGARLLRSPEPARTSARALLDRRLVAGEISPEQYFELESAMRSTQPAPGRRHRL